MELFFSSSPHNFEMASIEIGEIYFDDILSLLKPNVTINQALLYYNAVHKVKEGRNMKKAAVIFAVVFLITLAVPAACISLPQESGESELITMFNESSAE